MKAMHHLKRLLWFLLTIRFGVVLLLFLMVVMMFATQFEASTSTRAMKHFIYGAWWFDLGVYLFVINIVVNTWRRRPFKLQHIGFLTVHAGVLICTAGGLATRYFGIDGTMPIPEGTESQQIMLPDSDLVIEFAGKTTRYSTAYELTPWENDPVETFSVPGSSYQLRVDRYYPTAAVVDTLRDDATEENPMLRLALAGVGTSPQDAWLNWTDPSKRSFLHAGARTHFVADADSVQSVWSDRAAKRAGMRAGQLTLIWANGEEEKVDIPAHTDEYLPTSREGYTVEVIQVYRAFWITEQGAADAVDKPENPAIRFRLHREDAIEQHFAFTNFPDFRGDPPEGQTWELSHAQWAPSAGSLRGDIPQIAVARDGDHFVTYTSWKDPTDGMPMHLSETRSFENKPLSLRLLEFAERGRLSQTVQKVSDEVQAPVVHVWLEEGNISPKLASVFHLFGQKTGKRAELSPNRVWLFHGEAFDFDTPEGRIRVRYEGNHVPLDFAIHLDDFREETYPGIAMAASYESHVTVTPAAGEPFPHEIKMNHPLKYNGYTFYQASFQRTRNGDEITVLSVARDPGMTISFFGYIVLIAGLFLIFFVKPYFRKLDERIAKSRKLRLQGAQS